MSSATIPVGAAAPIAKLTKEVTSSSSGLIIIIILLGLAVVYLLIRYRNLDAQVNNSQGAKEKQDESFVSNVINQYIANPENRPHILRNILPFLPHTSSSPKGGSKRGAGGKSSGIIGDPKKKASKPCDVKMHSSPLGFGMPPLGLFDGGFLFPPQLLQGGGSVMFQTTIEDEETAATTGFRNPPTPPIESNATGEAPKVVEDKEMQKPTEPSIPPSSAPTATTVTPSPPPAPPTSGTKLSPIQEDPKN